jgi:proteasome lid subunit RPN8/RPN11
MLVLTKEHLAQIEKHAERDYPYECGGLLIGHFDHMNGKTVVELLPMENSSPEETRHNRVLILPQDLLRAEKYARTKKLDVVGYYHSHPDDRAVPSQFDLDHALPVWSYVIVSVRGGEAVDLRSWEMQEDRERFNEEKINQSEISQEN